MQQLKDLIDSLSSPQVIITSASVLLLLYLRFRSFTTKPPVALFMLTLMLVFFGFSMTDENFRIIVLKPDNVPIVAMLFLISFFMWFSLRRAVENDEAIQQGKPTFEGQESGEKLYAWPNLIYIEFIATILVGLVLIIWSVVLKAPLEEPADPSLSPNPSKAPWYFLGLQEMLVYFDPWLAGVVFPTLIVVGLMAIPYMDKNPKGSGYYTFKERPFAITIFLYGFLIMWVLLIMLGTFLRGPNWNFFGPYEYWDPHKVVPLVNVNLSEIFWVQWLNQPLPSFWLKRELPGFALIIVFFALTPFALARTAMKKIFVQIGLCRYAVLMTMLLPMIGLLTKMLLRWSFNLKYLVAIPEFFFNI